jgi:hypothetical protein
MNATRKIPKTLIALFLIAFTILLVWVIIRGQENSSRPPNTPSSQPPASPTAVPLRFKVNIPQKALWRNYVEVSVEATPGTKCELTFVPPAGKTHQIATMAGTNGLCVWNWKIEEADEKVAED